MGVESKVELLLFSLQAHTTSCIVQLELEVKSYHHSDGDTGNCCDHKQVQALISDL